MGRLAIYRAFYSRFADREVTDQKNYGGEHYLTRRELDMMMLNLRRFFPFPKGPLEEKFRIAGFKTKSESALLRDGLTDEELEDLSKHESLSKRIFRDIQDSQTSKESLDRLERHLKESNPPRWHLLTLYFDQAIHGRLKPWEKKAIIESLLERFGENVPLTTLKYLMNFSRNPSPGVNEEQFTYSDTLFEKLLELGRVHSLDQQVEKLEESFQIVSQARRQQRDQEIFAHRLKTTQKALVTWVSWRTRPPTFQKQVQPH